MMCKLLFFIRQLKAEKWFMLLGLFLGLLLAGSTIALLALAGWFISAAAFAGLTTVLAMNFNYFMPAAIIRALALTRILSRYAERVVTHDSTFKILTNLRVWFYQKIIPLSPAHLIKHRSGDLLNRIVHDIDTLDHLYLRVFSPLLIALLTTTIVTLFIDHFTGQLAFIALFGMLIALFGISTITYVFGNKIGRQIVEATATLRAHTVDCLQGLVDLLIFVKKNERLTTVFAPHSVLLNTQMKLANLKGFATFAMTLVSGLAIWLLLFVGIPLVDHNQLNGAILAMIVLCMIAAFDQLLSLPMTCLALGKTIRASTRVLNIANEPPVVVFPEQTTTSTNNYDLLLKEITFHYPNQTHAALTNITLDIPAGIKLGITGPSGAGKTTLIHLIARVWDPTNGNMTLGGIPLNQFSEAELRQRISLVTQQVHIFNATVRDNLTLMQSNNVSEEKLKIVLKLVELDQLIESLPKGLNTMMGELGKHFSGGQMRRIAIARALLQNALIQIWDEPSTGLDDALMQQIWQNCAEILADRTVIVVTHDTKLLEKMDQVITIGDGTLLRVHQI